MSMIRINLCATFFIGVFLYFNQVFGQNDAISDLYKKYRSVIVDCYYDKPIDTLKINRYFNDVYDIKPYKSRVTIGMTANQPIYTETYDRFFEKLNESISKFGQITFPEIRYEKKIIEIKQPINVPTSWEKRTQVIVKTPFNTYIDENKNFDVFFGGRITTGNGYGFAPFLVVKKYFQQHQFKSINQINLIIDDENIRITERYSSFDYESEKELALKQNNQIVAYRVVRIYILSMYNVNIDNIINKCKSGKVFIEFETMTGKISDKLSDTQINSLKELFTIITDRLKK